MISSFNYERVLKTTERKTASVYEEKNVELNISDEVLTAIWSSQKLKKKLLTLRNDSFCLRFCYLTCKLSIAPVEDDIIKVILRTLSNIYDIAFCENSYQL